MPVPGVTVLLVGDGARNAPVLEDHLRKRGCSICFASSKNEAMELLQDRQFDLILSEFMLSDGSALQFMSPLLGTKTTMFVSNAVEDGCWWMTAVFEGQDRTQEPGMRSREFRIRLDEVLYDQFFRPLRPFCRQSWSAGPRMRRPDSVTQPPSPCEALSPGPDHTRHRVQTAMRNCDDKTLSLMVLLWPLAVGVFAFGAFANAQTANPSRFDASPPARVNLTGIVDEVIRHACSSALLATQKEDSPLVIVRPPTWFSPPKTASSTYVSDPRNSSATTAFSLWMVTSSWSSGSCFPVAVAGLLYR